MVTFPVILPGNLSPSVPPYKASLDFFLNFLIKPGPACPHYIISHLSSIYYILDWESGLALYSLVPTSQLYIVCSQALYIEVGISLPLLLLEGLRMEAKLHSKQQSWFNHRSSLEMEAWTCRGVCVVWLAGQWDLPINLSRSLWVQLCLYNNGGAWVLGCFTRSSNLSLS